MAKRRRITWLRLKSIQRKCNVNGIPVSMLKKQRGCEVYTRDEITRFRDLGQAFDYLVELLKEAQEE